MLAMAIAIVEDKGVEVESCKAWMEASLPEVIATQTIPAGIPEPLYVEMKALYDKSMAAQMRSLQMQQHENITKIASVTVNGFI